MNRRNVINANTDLSRLTGGRRNTSFFPTFEPTARDLGVRGISKDQVEEQLTESSDREDDPS